MDRIQLEAYRGALRVGLQRLEAVTVSCGSCQRFEDGQCREFGAVPPVEVQRVGCDSWLFDGVPF